MPCACAAAVSPWHSAVVFSGEIGVEVRCLDQRQRGQTGRDGQRVAGEGSGLVHRAEWGDFAHDLAFAAKSTERHAAADNLAERGEVGFDAVKPLCALQPDAEAGHHFVKDQYRTVFRA